MPGNKRCTQEEKDLMVKMADSGSSAPDIVKAIKEKYNITRSERAVSLWIKQEAKKKQPQTSQPASV